MRHTAEDVLKTVRSLSMLLGHSPTLQEISDATGISIGTVSNRIKTLESLGLLERRGRSPRSLRIPGDEIPVVRLGPIDDATDVTDRTRIVRRVPAALSLEFGPGPPPDLFVVINDMTMDELVRPGDRVALHATQDWEDEAVVLLRHRQRLALRRCRAAGDGQILVSTQSRTCPLPSTRVAPDQLHVEGVMIGAITGRPEGI